MPKALCHSGFLSQMLKLLMVGLDPAIQTSTPVGQPNRKPIEQMDSANSAVHCCVLGSMGLYTVRQNIAICTCIS